MGHINHKQQTTMSSTAAAIDTPTSESAPGGGPFLYRREDYVGAVRHLVIFAVDLLVILLVIFPLSLVPAVLVHTLSAEFDSYAGLITLFLAWLYLAVLKPSRMRSVGYWMTGTRIVTINGGKPSPGLMTLRLFATVLWFIGWPVGFFFFDLLWATVDEERQTLRDLFSGTRLIRHNAKPIGRGQIVYSFYTACGLTLRYPSIRKIASGVVQRLPECNPGITGSSVAMATLSTFEPTPVTKIKPPADTEQTRKIRIVRCQNCGMLVVPKGNGKCPSCQTEISIES